MGQRGMGIGYGRDMKQGGRNMEEIPCETRYTAEEAYPEVRASGRDRRCALAILSNVGGGVSEMSAVGLYLYGQFTGGARPEVAECFRGIAEVEMRHLTIFAQLARQMGEDPRLWSPFQGRRRYWSPEYLNYPRRLDQTLRYAVEEERGCIRKYQQQLRWIGDENVAANLRRIIADEEVHVRVLTGLYQSYCQDFGLDLKTSATR